MPNVNKDVGDPGLLCFQHCKKDAKTFCFELPPVCPICDTNLQTSELRIPPFRVPYPFKEARKSPCSVVIKPTNGDFLHEYKNSADLHMGVTDSEGTVFEYDEDGLKQTKYDKTASRWNQCIAINVTDTPAKAYSPDWLEYWDFILNIVARNESWTPSMYKEESHNCYSFVLTFLRSLQLANLNKSMLNRTEFCKKYVLPRTMSAAKYISLFRHLIKNKVYIQR